MIVWQEEFPSSYRVPREIVHLVEDGVLEDMSWRHDPSPSFGGRLRDKNWLRLWVEHPDPEKRIGWEHRYTVIVQPEPTVPFGWKMVSTEDLCEALSWVAGIVRMKGPKCRFKIRKGEIAS